MIDVDASALLQLGIVLITYFILRGLVFAPLLATAAARTAKTTQARDDARALVKRAVELEARFEAQMLEVRLKASNVKDALRSEGVRQTEQIQLEARAAMGEKLGAVRRHVTEQVEIARGEMQVQIGEIGRAIAGRLLGRNF